MVVTMMLTKPSLSQVRAAIIEKKMAIYLKALEHNPDNIELLLGYLHECQQLWECVSLFLSRFSPPCHSLTLDIGRADKMIQVWEQVLQTKRQPEVWELYLAFRKQLFASFSVADIVALYSKAMVDLQHRKDALARVAGTTTIA